MSDYNHLESLKDKEYEILKKLTKNNLSEAEKNRLQKELEQTRAEIKRLR